ncbi:MAG: hypothetical protein Q7T59_05825 [Candidatus Woesebacteria bacterium]|nr:hypothetical protein [Candidatus Woesebacteria bacterium]
MTTETTRRTKEPQFTHKNKLILSEHGFTIAKLTGKSIRELIENGDLPISEYKISPDLISSDVLDERSRVSEVAYDLNHLFIPHSNKVSYEDQLSMIDEETKSLREHGVQGMKAYMVSIADVAEIAAIELKHEPERRIFGQKFVSDVYTRYPWVRTSTQSGVDAVIIGCDDLDLLSDTTDRGPEGEFRGIHIRNFPRASEKHSGLLVLRVFVPA